MKALAARLVALAVLVALALALWALDALRIVVLPWGCS